MDPNQQQLLLTGGVEKSTYVDDVFHTEVFVSPNQNADYKVTNNIDNAGEGGFLWYKQRNGTSWHLNWDTERGSNKYIYTNSTNAESTSELLKSFDSDGYTIKTGTTLVDPARENVLWNFRNQDGFFKVVKWTGNGVSGRQIAHGLGSTPGFVMTKALDNSDGWRTLHRWDFSKILYISSDMGGTGSSSQAFTGTVCDATHLTVTADGAINASGQDYIAYVFAGGASTEATAKSVACNGSNAYLTIPHSSDLDVGTGDWTVECWFKQTASFVDWQSIFTKYENGQSWGIWLHTGSNGKLAGGMSGANASVFVTTPNWTVGLDQWYHVAMCKSGTLMKMFVNGAFMGSVDYGSSDSGNNNGGFQVGALYSSGSREFGGEISNVRFTVGQALYTSSFRPSLDPLTTTSQGAIASNVKLLLCNNSSPTGSTVTTGTITNNNCTASSNSPFDDPDGYKFGKNEDQNIIKCGSYKGSSSADFEVNLGWEPQWIMFKRTDGTANWSLFDSMRGIVTDGNEIYLYPNLQSSEYTAERISATATGFIVDASAGLLINENNGDYIYIAIRRPDGYVGKPAEAGTDVFAMDYGASSGEPRLESGFPIDFAMVRQPATTENWYTGSRLTGANKIYTNLTDAMSSQSNFVWDYNDGWQDSSSTTYLSWMFKRHAGFDVVTYKGDHVDNRQIPHSLSKSPEMIWTKCRDTTDNWVVWHTGMPNSGDGENATAHMLLNLTNATGHAGVIYGGSDAVLPTSTHWSVGTHETINDDRYDYIAMLFASVGGISKCGSYTGNGSTSGHQITLGFQPRFLIVKDASQTGNWNVFDTTRGFNGSSDKILLLNSTQASANIGGFATPNSTGFNIITDGVGNNNGINYIYYAHA